MRFTLTRGQDRYEFEIDAAGYLYRVIYRGQRITCCHGGHNVMGSTLKTVDGNQEEVASNWLDQKLAMAALGSPKKRGKKR